MADSKEPQQEAVSNTELKVPKGTRDIDPFQSAVREVVIRKVVDVFKKHGGVTIETPVFELKATLTGKYGEDSKLIYDLADQGGEICSLRYDLTVPFARYIAMNKIHSMKRYQIAKVYRRDNPLMGRGKYREFYQCDFDIAGPTESMIAEAECCKMMSEILSVLEVGQYVIKLNHRRLLDGIFAACGVPEDKFRPICSAVDKLDKSPWDEVRKEMIEAKGLDAAVADKIWSFVQFKGTPEQVCSMLRASADFQKEGLKYVLEAIDEMERLFAYLAALKVAPPVVAFDLSLARGLDYYTGLIYEAVLMGEGQQLGSVAGGGRYDNLVGIFSKSGSQVPCVGFSVGIERLFGILEKNARAKSDVRQSPTEVMVVSMGPNMLPHRLALINELWDAGIRAEHLHAANPKPRNQLDYANDHKIQFAVIIGEGELAENCCGVKDLSKAQQTKVARPELISYLLQQLGRGEGGAATTSTAAAPAAATTTTTSTAVVPASKPAAQPQQAAAAAAAPEKGGKKGKKGSESSAPVARPEYIDHRIKIFEEIHTNQQKEYAEKAAKKVPIQIKLPDGSVKEGIAFETTPIKIAASISASLAKRSMISKVNGQIWDLTRPLEDSCDLEICDFTTKEGRDTFWHSTAHMMGEALELQYGVHLCIGPCNGIDQGFFYDSFMGDKVINESDYKVIESGVSKVASSKQPYQRIVITKEQALEIFKFNKFKCELINKFADSGMTMTCYRCGDLVDLCRGPHIPNTEHVKAMMVTNHGQAYWLGDSKNESLQRVYGVSFPDKKQLEEHKHFLEEAKKRDHRKLGNEYDLFFFDQLSPGSCFFLPHGARIYGALQDLMRSEYRVRGFQEVITPNMFNMKLWETSGHAAKYKADMFLLDIEGQEFGLKPMNCPGHCVMFKHRARSWRELPLRLADFGVLHRNEYSGALTGLTRVRRFQQDDAHIFCMADQVKAEIEGAINFMRHVYSIFGFEFTLELSTRPENFMGEISLWDVAEKNLEAALNGSGLAWSINPGDGAFYGPKIDIKVMDALKRKHQCATIQLDFQLPIRFDLEFMSGEGADGASKLQRPVMIHRAILGSVERMISVLTEHYGGKWPFWLSPRQVMCIPVAPSHIDHATQLARTITLAGFYAEVDASGRQLPKKVREAQLQQWNYILVIGDAEIRDNTVTVRARQESETDQDVDKGTWPFQEFLAAINELKENRSGASIPSKKPPKEEPKEEPKVEA